MESGEKGQVWRLLAWDWGGLLCFQAAHKLAGFLCILPLFRGDFAKLLQKASLQTLANRDWAGLFLNPQALALALGWLAVFFYYFYLEALFLAMYCQRAWSRERNSLWKLFLHAAWRGLELFRPRNWGLFPAMLLLLPAVVWPFAGSLGLAGQGLEALDRRLGGWAWLLRAPALAALVCLPLCFFFVFHLLAAEGMEASAACRASLRALKGRKIWALRQLLWALAPLALGLLLVYLAAVALTAGLSSLRWQQEEAAAVFCLSYLRWSRLARAGAFGAAASVYAAAAVSAYRRVLGQARPGPAGGRAPASPLVRRMRLIATAAALAALGGFSRTDLGGQVLYWTEAPVQVVAHRGGADLAPENTLEALEAARESGADLAEIDVRQTGDGAPVLLHDASLRRTHGLKAEIWDFNFEELKTAAPEPPIPSLIQAVRQADDQMGLMIELKLSGWDRSLAERTAAILRGLRAEGTCSVASMDLDMLARIKQIAPELKTIYIASLLRPEDYELEYLDGYSLRYNFLTPATVARLRRQGKEVYAWTVNNQRSIQWALYCQPDGIITDNPYLARFFMESGRENKALEFWTGLFYGYWADPIFQLD